MGLLALAPCLHRGARIEKLYLAAFTGFVDQAIQGVIQAKLQRGVRNDLYQGDTQAAVKALHTALADNAAGRIPHAAVHLPQTRQQE